MFTGSTVHVLYSNIVFGKLTKNLNQFFLTDQENYSVSVQWTSKNPSISGASFFLHLE